MSLLALETMCSGFARRLFLRLSLLARYQLRVRGGLFGHLGPGEQRW